MSHIGRDGRDVIRAKDPSGPKKPKRIRWVALESLLSSCSFLPALVRFSPGENTTPRYRRTCFACCHPVQYHHVASPREVLPQGQKNHRRKGNKYLEFPIMGSQVWVIKLVGFTCMKVGNGLSKEREICLCSGEKSQSRLGYHYAFT